MIDTIYVETAAAGHPRTAAILARYSRARVIECGNYREIFNRRAQNFRAQKTRPALILALKQTPTLYAVPGDQHLGAPHNYYFSHLLNCPFDCRYCFLQGMFVSANYVLFVNYESFFDDIRDACRSHREPVHFFSGYDCDSLALEPLTGFAAYFVERFASIDNAVLELRTKSTQIRSLLRLQPHEHCVVGMSLAPEVAVTALEHGAPSLEERLGALARLQAHGWQVGLRFDPIIALPDGAEIYETFFHRVFEQVDPDALHSVTIGALRLPRDFAKRMFRHYPEEPLFAERYFENDGILFSAGGETALGFATALLEKHVPAHKIFGQHQVPETCL